MNIRRLSCLLIPAVLLGAISARGGGTVSFLPPPGATLYGIDGRSPANIFEVDPTTGAVSNVEEAGVAGSEYSVEIYSIATQPGTNTIHCVYREGYGDLLPINGTVNGGMPVSLGTIDPATGAITRIADFNYETGTVYAGIAGITFCCDGSLYAVSGGQFPGKGMATETNGTGLLSTLVYGSGQIFSVDPATAALTHIVSGGSGRAQSLECHPETGLLYHFYTYENNGSGQSLETIDPATGAITPVPLTGDVYQIGIQGVVYAGEGFLGHGSGNTFYAISDDGIVGMVGPSPEFPHFNVRGLAYDKAIGCAAYQPDLLIGKRRSNLKVDDFYTRTGRRQTVRGVNLAARVGRSANVSVEIQNDGTVRDRIRVRWRFEVDRTGNKDGLGPRFMRQIFAVGGGGRKNVTEEVQKKGLALNPGEKQRLVFMVSVKREPRRNVTSRSAIFRAVSLGDRSKIDVGNAQFRIQK